MFVYQAGEEQCERCGYEFQDGDVSHECVNGSDTYAGRILANKTIFKYVMQNHGFPFILFCLYAVKLHFPFNSNF